MATFAPGSTCCGFTSDASSYEDYESLRALAGPINTLYFCNFDRNFAF